MVAVGPLGMRLRSLLQSVVVLLACLASGTLECGGTTLSPTQRRGAQLYMRMCSVCHGAEGQGYAADEAPALANKNFLASASDTFLRGAIDNGRSATTMSAWSNTHAGPLSSSDVDSLVAFLHTWRKLPHALLDESPLAGDATRGEGVFTRECVRCHGNDGTGGPFVHIGNFDLLSTASNGFLRHAIRFGRPGTAMPAFESSLDRGSIEDALALMRSWQSRLAELSRPAPSHPPPLPLGPVPLNPRGPAPIGFQTAPHTTPADAIKSQLDRGARMGVLDARAPADYLNEHIAGAVSVPFYDPDPYLAQLPKDAWLVCYCACPHAESGSLAAALVAKGFTKVTVLDEGLPVWKARNYPTHVGVDP